MRCAPDVKLHILHGHVGVMKIDGRGEGMLHVSSPKSPDFPAAAIGKKGAPIRSMVIRREAGVSSRSPARAALGAHRDGGAGGLGDEKGSRHEGKGSEEQQFRRDFPMHGENSSGKAPPFAGNWSSAAVARMSGL
jgi:hypothetical protein